MTVKEGRMKEIYVRFMAEVNADTTEQLLQIVDRAVAGRYDRLNLMLSSPGGHVFYGLSIYNFLRGAPLEVYTYNFGSVDSMSLVVYCAGLRRFSVPHARFLVHGVHFNLEGRFSFDEKQIEEILKGIHIDQENMSRVIADTTGKNLQAVEQDMHNRTTLNAAQAKDYGLVHEVRSELFPVDADFAVVREQRRDNLPPAPSIQAYARYWEIDRLSGGA